ncbi:MipA/OmpV family protein [Massilia yuzhufengensis]|uniref:Outer membrane scaffolding protein for murein synthesis, MipA/OmpV family n=1 Tax=Massilia yuzhufengensis TaxID=1164594 RepID=A0A1I1FJ52_9BURK|nr:MipA/OmpV family protein [Massilia yuzhufengensis]SFB99334.1 Outer membrane scaffolding protein for murein synthesis, MipA/OmpV family [Massilia yuzhufengensis]
MVRIRLTTDSFLSTMTILPKAACAACLIVSTAASAQSGSERNLPLWELGLGAAALSTPSYPGADERESRLLVFPNIVYRGEVLRADRSGVNARLFRSERVELDVGFAGALPSDSDDVDERSGMPDLGPLVEFGPRLKIRLADLGERRRLRAEIPLRAVIEARGGLHGRGYTFEPRLAYEMAGERGVWTLEGNVSAVWGDRRINRHFYEVAPQYATASRPAYAADGGLLATRLGLFGSRRIDADLRVFGYVRFESYQGAANRDSPLHVKDSGVSGGVGVMWTFKRSSRPASGREPVDPAGM